MKRVKCKSGITGWQGRLQKQYDSFEQFKAYASMYDIHKRLGFRSMKSAWEANPIIRESVIPEDLEVVRQ